MDIRRFQELKWHEGILKGDHTVYKELIDAYLKPVLDHLLGGFGNYLRHDLSLAHEAVWLSFQFYLNHPCCYQPARGSLRAYLQIHAIRRIQKLLHEENRNWHFQQLNFVLPLYFDNEQDIRLAMQILKDESDWCELARILDVGALPIGQQLREITRNISRIRQVLRMAPVDFHAMANRRKTGRRLAVASR